MPEEPEPTVLIEQPSRLSRIINRLEFFKSWSRRRKLITTSLVMLLIAGGGWLVWGHGHNKNPATQLAQNIASAPTTVASPLTGVQVAPASAERPITAVMIENSTDARPQSGLQDAGVVFEAVAEGGITRFAALFQETAPQYVGPVRSVRPYYLDWVRPFHASVAHVGGSPAALVQVRANMRDLDEFFNANTYWRIDSREAPHNVYTSFAKLDALNKSKGYKFVSFASWPRKADAPMTTPTAKTIDLTLSGPLYDVSYTYHAADNSYYRDEGGAPHYDTNASGKAYRLHPKVVIAMVVPLGQGALDASGAYYSDYVTLGTSTAYIFQDGGVTKGTWTKKGASNMLVFKDAQGNPIALDAGQTWITAVSSSAAVTHSAK